MNSPGFLVNGSSGKLRTRAIDALNKAIPAFKKWIEKVRQSDDCRWRFRFAVKSRRPPDCLSTFCVLQALENMGVLDEVLTEEDQTACRNWIRGMHQGDGQYWDGALFDRSPPDWPEDEPYPSPAVRESINGYCRAALDYLGDSEEEQSPREPPQGWPALKDGEDAILKWITTRPWHTDPWGGCSHMNRMATYVCRWVRDGKASVELLVRIIIFFYRIQEDDGLWGAKHVRTSHRINGTYKIFGLMQHTLDLPLLWADQIVDKVLQEFYRPDYDADVGLCDEMDNWVVLEKAIQKSNSCRRPAIEKLAAWRIVRMLEIFGKDDGGYSYYPGKCLSGACGIDLAEELPQGEAHAAALMTPSINICIRMLGIEGQSLWKGSASKRVKDKEIEDLRGVIIDAVFGKNGVTSGGLDRTGTSNE